MCQKTVPLQYPYDDERQYCEGHIALGPVLPKYLFVVGV